MADAEFWRELKPAPFGAAIPANGTLHSALAGQATWRTTQQSSAGSPVLEGQLSQVNQVVAGSRFGSRKRAVWANRSSPIRMSSAWSAPGRPARALPRRLRSSRPFSERAGRANTMAWVSFISSGSRRKIPVVVAQLQTPRSTARCDHHRCSAPARWRKEQVLKPRDVLLNIDSFDLDIQGDCPGARFRSR